MKRMLSLLLAVMLLSLATACGSGNTATPAEPDQTPATDVNSLADEADAAQDETPAETPDEPGVEAQGADVALPFAEQKTFTFWMNSLSLPTGYTDYNDCEIYQELERRTNAHINWTIPSMANAAEQSSLMLTSGTYTDVFASPVLTGGYDYSIEEEIIIDLSELMPVYAPHYWALMNADEPSRRELYTDEGNLPGLQCINKSYEPNFLGYWVRQDWLDKVGYTGTLETYDDWEEAMRLWKEQLGITNACFLDSPKGQGAGLMAGFDTSVGWEVFDGQVVYAPVEQGYHDYLEKMAHWYAEGYLDQDFTSHASFFSSLGDFTSGAFGLFNYFNSGAETLLTMGTEMEPDYAITPVDFPRRNADDLQRVRMVGNAATLVGGAKTCISAQCEEPEAVLQWFDYLFTDEGYMLANYGIEGESYNLEDGKVVYTDYFTNNPEMNATDMGRRYQLTTFSAIWYDWGRNLMDAAPVVAEASAIWDARWDPAKTVTLPAGVSLSYEESENVTSRLNDIQTQVEEYTARVIIGETNLDSTWQSFVDNCYQMGLQDGIDTYQAAYERYLTR